LIPQKSKLNIKEYLEYLLLAVLEILIFFLPIEEGLGFFFFMDFNHHINNWGKKSFNQISFINCFYC